MFLLFLLSAAASAPQPAAPTAADLPDVPYSWELSALAQRYYGQCRAEAKLRDRIVRDFNQRHLSEPPFQSFRSRLSVADRHDADLVCLGAAFQQFDDAEPGTTIVPPPPPAGAAVPPRGKTRAKPRRRSRHG